jgi:tetratricopeptide (TPR) repeat protein
MNKIKLTLVTVVFFSFTSVFAQPKGDVSNIDIMLIRGDYKKVIDTCLHIITADSLNSDVYYKMGLAYLNLISEEKSFDCFVKAAAITPGNNSYSFMVAKSYYGKGKPNLARPILQKLCTSDSLNWTYAYYLT